MIVFLVLRIALLFARQPFFDEVFTVWITAKPFSGILRALLQDSGPPLYYFVIHALTLHSVIAMRVVSLVCAGVTLWLLRERGFAALLFAVFPPAVLFAVDARAYAMCAMFVTIGVLALDRDRYEVAAIAFVFAAYSHYYGFLFFPLLIKHWRALLVAVVAFAPGLWLAFQQPKAATEWISGAWPDALFVRPPIALVVILALASAVAVVRWNRFTTMTAVPIAFALLLTIAGRPIYLPLRFESIIAIPLLLAISSSLSGAPAPPPARTAVVAAFVATSLLITAPAIEDHASREQDAYRAAALWSRRINAPIVASGYCYLETAVARGNVTAFPPEQANHPGWRANASEGSAQPRGTFYWIGERGAPELAILRRTRKVQPIYVNARALVARVM